MNIDITKQLLAQYEQEMQQVQRDLRRAHAEAQRKAERNKNAFRSFVRGRK